MSFAWLCRKRCLFGWFLAPFSTSFQLYRSDKCTYLSFPRTPFLPPFCTFFSRLPGYPIMVSLIVSLSTQQIFPMPLATFSHHHGRISISSELGMKLVATTIIIVRKNAERLENIGGDDVS